MKVLQFIGKSLRAILATIGSLILLFWAKAALLPRQVWERDPNTSYWVKLIALGLTLFIAVSAEYFLSKKGKDVEKINMRKEWTRFFYYALVVVGAIVTILAILFILSFALSDPTAPSSRWFG